MFSKYSLYVTILCLSFSPPAFCMELAKQVIDMQKQIRTSIKLPEAIAALCKPETNEAHYAYFAKKGEEVANLLIQYLSETPPNNVVLCMQQAHLETCIWEALSTLCYSANPQSNNFKHGLAAFHAYVQAFCARVEALKPENINFAQKFAAAGESPRVCLIQNKSAKEIVAVHLRSYKRAKNAQNSTAIDQILYELKGELQTIYN